MSESYRQPAYVVRIEADLASAEGLAESLAEDWRRHPTQFQRPDESRVYLDLCFPDEVRARLVREAVAGDARAVSVEVIRTDPADWERAFRDQFPIREIGSRLRILPVWKRAAAPSDHRINLWIDPGLSFGTGTHFTTAFCLAMMDRLWHTSSPVSFLDVGTGSGLLAVAAVRLGCPRVEAVEADAAVLPYARRNLALNHVEDAVVLREATFGCGDLSAMFDVVCANLISGLLLAGVEEMTRIAGRVLVMSGIREVEVDDVAGAYIAAGWKEEYRDGDGEWAGLVMNR